MSEYNGIIKTSDYAKEETIKLLEKNKKFFRDKDPKKIWFYKIKLYFKLWNLNRLLGKIQNE